MNFMSLRYFIDVARYESFSEAARRLYTSQPNLSKQIGTLESELGFKLFRRAHRAVFLTPAGRFLYDELKGIPDHTEKVIEHARAIVREDTGRLSIGTLEGQYINSVLPDIILKFKELEPDLEVDLECVGFKQLRGGLESKQYDLIITLSIELAHLGNDVSFERLLDQYGAVAVSSKRKISTQDYTVLADFKDESFITVSPEESARCYERLQKVSKVCGFTPKIARKVNSLESLLMCVEMGIGVGIVDRDAQLEKCYDIDIIEVQDVRPEAIVAVWRTDNQNLFLGQMTKAMRDYFEVMPTKE